MNKLIRTVKTFRTAKKLLAPATTVFEVTTYGYRQDGSVSSNIISDRVFEVYAGSFDCYPKELRKTQKAQLFKG
jgi:hypothetical protein